MRHHAAVLVTAMALAALACQPQDEAGNESTETQPTMDKGADRPQEIAVTAADFHYQAPDTIAAGLTTLRMLNQGPELHHVQLVRIAEGHTVQELLERVQAGDVAPSWVTLVGGPNASAPGESAEATLMLEPGDYAIVCFIPSPGDGVPHLMKGMMKPLTVTAAGAVAAAEPQADVVMKLDDYTFEIAPAIRAGRRTIRVENLAAQPHEVLLVQLAPGKTAADVAQWIEKPAGPPPGKPLGGTTLLGQGEVNFVTADFAPGEYALLCFVPDAGDGRPHIAHGMVSQIRVE